LAYNLSNFLRRLALPHGVKHWSLTTLREKLIKIGAKVVTHSRYAVFQMAELAVPRALFARILERIQGLGVPPRSNKTPSGPHRAWPGAAQKRTGPRVPAADGARLARWTERTCVTDPVIGCFRLS